MPRSLQHDETDLGHALGEPDAHDADYDALAELFLGGPAPAAPGPAPREVRTPAGPPEAAASGVSAMPGGRPARAEIEALVLGHLPVMSAPWASQYAAVAAQYEGRPIAVLRMASGSASIEVFGDAGLGAQPPEPAASFERAVRDAAGRTSRWIVRVDATDELAVAESPLVRSVTLLCGADEAAVVGAYRTLKALAGAMSDTAPDGPAPTMRVAIMGADDGRARQAAEKLQQACTVFLDRPLEAATPVGRIGPVRPARLFFGTANRAPEAVVRLIAEAVAGSRAASPPRPEDPAAARNLANGASWVECPASRPGEDPKAGSCVQVDSCPREFDGASATEGASEALLSDVLLRAAPVTPREAGAALSELMTGFTPLPVRCPYDDSVELATDAEGALQLLASAGDRAVESLVAVADWVAAHASLLALACPALRMPRGVAPVRRLFTDRADAVRRLLDGDLRVHLVVRVAVDGREVRTCVDLN